MRRFAEPHLRELGLRQPLEVLDRHDVRYVVIGGIAAIAQGYPLTTQDLDVTPAKDFDNLDRIVMALEELQAQRRTPGEPVAFPIDAKMIAAADAWTLVTNQGLLDLLFAPSGTTGFADLRRDAVAVDLGLDRPTLVASLRDLIRMKEASKRPKDEAQLPALRRTLEVTRRSDLEQ
jgi:hypothetical protein